MIKTKSLSINFPVPSIDFQQLLKGVQINLNSIFVLLRIFLFKLRGFTGTFFSRVFEFPKNFVSRRNREGYQDTTTDYDKPKRNYKKIFRFVGVTLAAVFLVILVSRLIKNNTAMQSADAVQIQDALASEDINREFSFPLKDDSGETVSNIKYIIEKVELRNEILIKGQKATSVQGRTFLIATLKVVNDYKQSVQINSKDYVRLSVNGADDWLAPEIHNDPVEVQAISTKYTRLGFTINDSDKNLLLRVGEIDSDKQEIPLNLK
jgi:hypothetical protein